MHQYINVLIGVIQSEKKPTKIKLTTYVFHKSQWYKKQKHKKVQHTCTGLMSYMIPMTITA